MKTCSTSHNSTKSSPVTRKVSMEQIQTVLNSNRNKRITVRREVKNCCQNVLITVVLGGAQNQRFYQNRYQGQAGGNRFNGYPNQQRGSGETSPSSGSTHGNERHQISPSSCFDNMNQVYCGTPPPQVYSMAPPAPRHQPYMMEVPGIFHV